MTTTPEGRRELKALAEKATPGPWKADGTIYEHMVSEIRSIMPGEERGIAQVWQHPQGFADARFIAAANPATVLSLLAALEEAEGRLDEHALFDAETDLAFKDLDAQIATLTARAEASEQRVEGLSDALTDCVNWIVELANSGDAGFWDAEKTPERQAGLLYSPWRRPVRLRTAHRHDRRADALQGL